jgi:hypothetical protein
MSKLSSVTVANVPAIAAANGLVSNKRLQPNASDQLELDH